MRLNDQQQSAVDALDGPVLVSAGAGSGKTRVLTERFVHAVDHAPAPGHDAVSDIVAITYTDRAAGELAERIRADLRRVGKTEEARAIDGAWISTIHGFCSRILKRKALDAGLDPGFGVCDTVTAGTLKARAFERAASRLVAAGGAAVELFSSYTWAELADSAEEVAKALRANGLSADSLVAEGGADIARVKSDLAVAFGTAGDVLGACTDGNVTTAQHLAECERVAGTLRLLDAKDLAPEEVARQVIGLMSSYGASGGGKAIKATVDSLRDARESAAADAMTLLMRELTTEFIELVRAYELEYQGSKQERSLLDFDDLQTKTLDLLKCRPDIAEQLRESFRYTMVDEFQDTDALQLGIVEHVAGKNLCTVGDERQSIYGFRGANIEVYRAHVRDMHRRGATPVELGCNYRSHAQILGFVNELFGSNDLFGSSLIKLVASREEAEARVPADTPRVRMRAVRAARGASEAARVAEARAVAEEFATLRDVHGFAADEMVVLLRAYTHAEVYAEALRQQGFSALVQGGSRFFDLKVVQAMRALVDAIANADDDEAVAVLCASELGRLSDAALWALRRPESPERLWAALQGDLSALAADDRVAAQRVSTALTRARHAVGNMPVAEILLRAVEDLALDLVLAAKGDEGLQDLANVLKFARLANTFEATGGVGPSEFSAYIKAKEQFRDHEAPAAALIDGSGAVRVMSMHSAKGLEFPVVALPDLGCNNNRRGTTALSRVAGSQVTVAMKAPTEWLGLEKSCVSGTPLYTELADLQKLARVDEGKRLFYVGCTRAREVLLLTGTLNASGPTANTMFSWAWPAVTGTIPADGEHARVRFGDHELDVAVLVPENAEDADEEEPTAASALFEPPIAHGAEEADGPPAPTRLSYSHFSAYKDCPKRFLAMSIAGMPEREVEGGGGLDPRTFGSAVHAVLEAAEGQAASPELIRRLSARFGLDSQKELELEQSVRAFEVSEWAQRVAAATRVRRETPFALRVGHEQGFVLFGNIDLYAEEDGRVLIVDYKTGRSGGREELSARYRLQARCYGLAALRAGAPEVELAFVRPQVTEPDGSMQAVTFELAPSDAPDIEAELLQAWGAMASGQYEPLDRWDQRLCPSCPIANGICPVRA